MGDDRPFIVQFRTAVMNSNLAPAQKLVLMALAQYADADGGSCFPSITTVARMTSQNARTVRRHLAGSAVQAWAPRASRGAKQGWRRYEYALQLPEGADIRPARQLERGDTSPATMDVTCGHSEQDVRALTTEGAGTVSHYQALTKLLPRKAGWQKHSGATAVAAFGPAVALAPSETPAEKHRNYVNQCFVLGVYGDGPEAVAERDRELLNYPPTKLGSVTA